MSPIMDNKNPGGLFSASYALDSQNEIKKIGVTIFQNVLRFMRFSNEKREDFALFKFFEVGCNRSFILLCFFTKKI